MCQGCEDYLEFEEWADRIIAAELPAMLAQPLDHSVFYGH